MMNRPDGLMNLSNEAMGDLLKSLVWHKGEIKLMRKSDLRHEMQGVIESIQWELRVRNERMV